ncbi:MAG: addiction module protein [Bacteroidia bacterium]
MNATTLKHKLHSFIDNAEQKKLKAIYTLFESEIETTSMLTDEQKKELDFRLDEYMQGKSKSFTWEEAVKKIKAKHK